MAPPKKTTKRTTAEPTKPKKAEKPKPKPKPKKAKKAKPPPKKKAKRPSAGDNVTGLLATVGILDAAADFAGCANLDAEFSVIKRAWHKSILAAHPDKGGDRETFEAIQSAFEVLKDMKLGEQVDSFVVAAKVRLVFFSSFCLAFFFFFHGKRTSHLRFPRARCDE